MNDNNSGPGIPDKPLASPTLNDVHDTEVFGSDHPAHTRNVSTKRRGWSKAKLPAPLLASKKRQQVQASENDAAANQSGRSRRKLPWYAKAGTGALLLAAGIAIGFTLPDPTNSREFIALSSEKEAVQSELSKLQTRYTTLDAGIKSREAKIQTREDAVTKADAAVKTADAAVKKREEAITAAEKTKAANTIKEGTWTVGVDLEPGTYRANTDVVSGCYWGIYRTGSNGSDIVDNDIVTGGRPSVTLSAGQDFKTSRCGTWSKQ